MAGSWRVGCTIPGSRFRLISTFPRWHINGDHISPLYARDEIHPLCLHLNTCNTRLDISHHTPLHSHDMLKRKSPYGSASPAPGIRGASAGVKAEGPDVKRVKGGLRAGCWMASAGALGVGTRLLGAAGPGSGYSLSYACCERHSLASRAVARLVGLRRGKGRRCQDGGAWGRRRSSAGERTDQRAR